MISFLQVLIGVVNERRCLANNAEERSNRHRLCWLSLYNCSLFVIQKCCLQVKISALFPPTTEEAHTQREEATQVIGNLEVTAAPAPICLLLDFNCVRK